MRLLAFVPFCLLMISPSHGAEQFLADLDSLYHTLAPGTAFITDTIADLIAPPTYRYILLFLSLCVSLWTDNMQTTSLPWRQSD